MLESRGSRVARWIGDDAAVVEVGGGAAVVSTDTMVEGVHFRLDWISAADAGHRALAGALSDLAAMGVDEGGEAYIALGVGGGLDADSALELVRGAEALARSCAVTIAGGDVVRSPVAFLTVTVVGWAADSGAVVGMLCVVTEETERRAAGGPRRRDRATRRRRGRDRVAVGGRRGCP